MPLVYRVTSVWGNHEGSMLLWVLILSLFGALVARLRRQPAGDAEGASCWRCSRGSLAPSICSSCITSNPFLRACRRRRSKAATSIRSCRTSASRFIRRCSISAMSASRSRFRFAIAALIEGRIDAAWARWVRPWTLAAWMFLTVGIAMGSYWAYYELGWGGFWFWDPVENASLMPWLAGTALLHSAVVMEKRNALESLDHPAGDPCFLAVADRHLPGALGRAHVRCIRLPPIRRAACSSSPFWCCSSAAGLTLFAWRAPMLKQGGLFAPISREGALVLNNLFLTTACADRLCRHRFIRLALEALTGDENFRRSRRSST